MTEQQTYRKFIYTNSYLLVVAAWLLTISFVIDNYWSVTASIQSVSKSISQDIRNRENDFNSLMKDTLLLQKLQRGSYGEQDMQRLVEKKYFLFFYEKDTAQNDNLVCWNTQQVLPYPSLLYDNRSAGFIRLENGYYIWKRHVTDGLKVLALIPVKWQYSINNEYLVNDFVVGKSIAAHYDVTADTTKGVGIYSVNGRKLFNVVEMAAEQITRSNPLAIAMQALAAILLLLFIHLFSTFLVYKRNLLSGASFLIMTVVSLRVIGYYYPVPFQFRQFDLFDPAVYGSNYILRSLGDLLLNVLIFTWFILFIRNHFRHNNEHAVSGSQWKKWGILLAGASIILMATFTGAIVIRSLVADSQISFDVLHFFTLNAYSIIGFIVLCCMAIGYYFLCQLVLYYIKPYFVNNIIPVLLSVTLTGLLFLSFRIGRLPGGFEIFVLFWLVLFLALLSSSVLNLIASKIISSKLVFWVFFFSVSITSILMTENRKKELRKRLHYAEILAQKSDPANESLINSMMTDFNQSFLTVQFNRFKQQADNFYLKDSLVNSNTTGYINKYDTRIFTFDADQQSLYNQDSTSYDEVNAILETQSKPTNTRELFYFDESYDVFSYISRRTVYDYDSSLLGYVFIIASPKKVKKDALYPELFNRGEQNAIENSSLYAFAIYNNWKLVSSHNDYPFPSEIPKSDFRFQHEKIKKNKDYSELWYYAGAGRVVAIAKSDSLSIESITLFSYMFCSFLVVSALFWLISAIIRSRLNLARFKSFWQLTIRNQIHGTIIFISVLSFIIIGFATILFFISRYETNNREKLNRTIKIMENEVRIAMQGGWKMNDTLKNTSNFLGEYLEQSVRKVSEIHGVDVNLYDLKGNLMASSLPMIYTKGIISSRMHPLAYYHLIQKKEVQYYQKEYIGKLPFASNYVPVRDDRGNDYAYLNIPYFTSQSNLRQEISNFLVTIINLNAFIFLVAGIIALFITNRITASFSLISEKMKKVNLGTHNEAIEWKHQDELGQLVNEYNKMVNQLEKSAEVMAKSEREGAWREMARQVAHEIKNPLTPMKLSIQYLQKAIESNAPNVKELATQVAGTLVEQINHLNQIAGDFSQFAHIGDARKERIDLNEVIDNVLSLYAMHERVSITRSMMSSPVFVIGDKTHANRLFNNLLLNAIQAVPENKVAEINVSLYFSNGSVVIRISDNGPGIDEHIQPKIFTPNFTTKSSGTGLGLAMCKRIVEQADGDIWFETKAGAGTSFFVKWPMVS